MNWLSFFYAEDNAAMTFPNSSNPKLIFTPSRNVAPEAPVFFALSEPARSTK